MADISVSQKSGGLFQVKVDENGSSASFQVSVPPALFKKVAQGKATEGELIEASFRFLLDRESKESILSSFDLTVISRYFPEYESKIGSYLK